MKITSQGVGPNVNTSPLNTDLPNKPHESHDWTVADDLNTKPSGEVRQKFEFEG